MAKDPTPSHAVADALQGIPFDNIIGGGLLNACIEVGLNPERDKRERIV